MLTLAFNIQSVNAQPDPDLNDDGKVDITDIAIAALAFISYPGHPRWNAEADLNQDNTINLIDIGLICIRFGSYP